MPRKAASGSGTIRKKEIVRNGTKYVYWEGRYMAGRDPLTGKPVRKSITGKTQKEVAQKLREVVSSGSDSAYNPNSGITLEKWLNLWITDYAGEKKETTIANYKTWIDYRIAPALGKIKLEHLQTNDIQRFYNGLRGDISAKTVRNIHGILHSALAQAVRSRIIPFNPADACALPRVEKREITPIVDDDLTAFLSAIKDSKYEDVYLVDVFTGMRQGEILGLTWDCVDFKRNRLCVNKQLARVKQGGGTHVLRSTKKDNIRYIAIPAMIAARLKAIQRHQQTLAAEDPCTYRNDMNLVFTDDTGKHLVGITVYKHLKKIFAKIGMPESRFHDLRHSYAVALLEAGVDVKTLQTNLGHSNISTTLDVYAHVTQKLKADSADKLEKFVSGLQKQG